MQLPIVARQQSLEHTHTNCLSADETSGFAVAANVMLACLYNRKQFLFGNQSQNEFFFGTRGLASSTTCGSCESKSVLLFAANACLDLGTLQLRYFFQQVKR